MEVYKQVLKQAPYEFIEHIYPIDDIGYIRYEIYDDVLFVHPVLEELSKDNFKTFKDKLYSLTRMVMDKYFYDMVFISTPNKQLVRLYGKGIVHEVPDGQGGTLYYVNREDI